MFCFRVGRQAGSGEYGRAGGAEKDCEHGVSYANQYLCLICYLYALTLFLRLCSNCIMLGLYLYDRPDLEAAFVVQQQNETQVAQCVSCM